MKGGKSPCLPEPGHILLRAHNSEGAVFVGVMLMYSSHFNVNINWMLEGKKNLCLGSCSCPNGADSKLPRGLHSLPGGIGVASFFFTPGASNHNYTT